MAYPDSINTSATGPLAALDSDGAATNTLTFPSDLRGHGQNFILFRALKDFHLTRSAAPKENSVASIALPLPGNLSTSYNAQYSVEGIGPIGEGGSDIAAGGGGLQGVAQRLSAKFKENNGADIKGALLDLASTAADPVIAAVAASIGGLPGAATGAVVAQAFKGALGGKGIARNPHIAALFTGTNFRSHAFQYKFTARNSQESDALRSIIKTFKYHMSPGYKEAGHFFDYPEQFEIDIVGGDYLFDIGVSVLTSFDVNYGSDGAAYHFEDTNAPFSITLAMTFQEIAITTKSEIYLGNR